MRLIDQLKFWREQGLSCVKIGLKIRRHPSSVYYLLRKYNLTDNPLKLKVWEDRRIIEEDFNLYEWQVLLGIISSSKCRIKINNNSYRIVVSHHIKDIKTLIWKVKKINDLKIIGTCRYILNYSKNNQITAEYSSSKLGPVLYQLKKNKTIPLYHLIAKTIHYIDTNDSYEVDMDQYLREISEMEYGEFEKIGKSFKLHIC